MAAMDASPPSWRADPSSNLCLNHFPASPPPPAALLNHLFPAAVRPANLRHGLPEERLPRLGAGNRPNADLAATKAGEGFDPVRVKLAREFLRVGMADAEGYERADVPENGGAHGRRHLVEILMADHEGQAVFARLGQDRGEGV